MAPVCSPRIPADRHLRMVRIHAAIGGATMTVFCPRAAACALMVLVVSGSPAWAGAPTEALRHSIDRIFALLDDPAFKDGERAVARQRELLALADSGVDFSEAARRTLGATWDGRTPAERAHFVRLFADLIAHAYL